MKALVIVLSLMVVGSNQAMAGKRMSSVKNFLQEWKTPSSALYLPRISRYLVGGGFCCHLFLIGKWFFAPTDPATSLVISLVGAAGVLGGVSYGLSRRSHVKEGEEIGVKVLYLDDYGELRSGEVVSIAAYGRELRVEGHGPMSIDFKIRKSILMSSKTDIYRAVEILSEAGNAESLRHVGYVVEVLNNGFYQLELLAEVDPSIDIDPSRDYLDHAIEPYRIIIDEAVAFEDGGFRFDRRVSGVVYENLFEMVAQR